MTTEIDSDTPNSLAILGKEIVDMKMLIQSIKKPSTNTIVKR